MFIKLHIDFGVLFSFSSALIKCSIFHMGGGEKEKSRKKNRHCIYGENESRRDFSNGEICLPWLLILGKNAHDEKVVKKSRVKVSKFLSKYL